MLGQGVPGLEPGLYLVIGLLVDDGGMDSVHDGPLLPGIVDGNVLDVAPGSFADVALLVPHNLAGKGGIAEDVADAVPGELLRAVGLCTQGVDVVGNGDHAISLKVEVVDHTDKFCLGLVDLQSGLAVHHGFPVAVGSVGHIAPLLDGLLQAAPEPLGDDLVFPAGDEGLHLGVFLIDLVGQVVDLFRCDNQSAGLPEGIKDDALVLHPTAGESVQIHTQHGVVLAVLHVLKQAEHLGPGVEGLAADYLGIGVDDVNSVGGSVVGEGLLVFGQYLVGGHALLHPALAEVGCSVRAREIELAAVIHRGLLSK